MMNEQLFSQLYNAARFLDTCDDYRTEIAKINNDTQRYRNTYSSMKSLKASAVEYIVIAIALIVIGFPTVLYAILMIGMIVFAILNAIVTINQLTSEFVVLIAFISLFLSYVVASAFTIKICSSKAKKKKQKQSAEYLAKAEKYWNETAAPAIAENEEKLKRLNEEYDQFVSKHSSCLEFLPKTYRSIEATAYLAKIVRDLRADTLKEALNIYEQDMQYRELQEQMYETSRIQAEEISRLRKETQKGNAILEDTRYLTELIYYQKTK